MDKLSERQRIRELEKFKDGLMPGLAQLEQTVFTALNNLSFSIAVIADTLKKKNAFTDEDLKESAEALKKVLEEQQKAQQKKIVIPGQSNVPSPTIITQDELSKLGEELDTAVPEVKPGE